MNFFSYERQVCDSENYHILAFILLYESAHFEQKHNKKKGINKEFFKKKIFLRLKW